MWKIVDIFFCRIFWQLSRFLSRFFPQFTSASVEVLRSWEQKLIPAGFLNQFFYLLNQFFFKCFPIFTIIKGVLFFCVFALYFFIIYCCVSVTVIQLSQPLKKKNNDFFNLYNYWLSIAMFIVSFFCFILFVIFVTRMKCLLCITCRVGRCRSLLLNEFGLFPFSFAV